MSKLRQQINSKSLVIILCLSCVAATTISFAQTNGSSTIQTKHALLVGVSEYPSPDITNLNGPKNDVSLIRQVLRNRGFRDERISVLADGVEGADGHPTRALILNALQALAANTGLDDFVYLHFSGHGSQQVANGDDNEPDRLDEVFVSRDVQHWNDQGEMPNAIVDNELEKAITNIRRNGTFVWLVFDNCHAGTMTRSIQHTGERDRKLEVPDRVKRLIEGALRGDGSTATSHREEKTKLKMSNAARLGDYVAFYAAQSNELTPELPLPVGSDTDSQVYGLFTYTLSQVLELNPSMSYNQTAQQILQHYAASNRPRPTPLFEGTGMHNVIFDNRAAGKIRQWPLRRERGILIIDAGKLHYIANGSRLAVFANATETDPTEALGYVQAKGVEVFKTQLEPIVHDGKTLDRIPKQAQVRLLEQNIALKLSVALPPTQAEQVYESTRASFTTNDQRLFAALNQARDDKGSRRVQIDWVPSTASADVRLLIKDDLLRFLPPSSALGKQKERTPVQVAESTTKPKELVAAIESSLTRVAKANNLMRLAKPLSKSVLNTQLDISARIERAANGEVIEFSPIAIPSLKHGDIIHFTIKNLSPRHVDLTALFLNSRFGIVTWYPYLPEGETNRIEKGGQVETALQVSTRKETGEPDTFGMEHMLFVAVAARPVNPETDFSFLSQPDVTAVRSKGVQRGPENSILALFEDAGFGPPDTRNATRVPSAALDQTTVRLLSWEVARD